MRKKVYVESFGCQMNQLEAELVIGNLSKDGYMMTLNPKEADVVILNTCSVREHAEDRALSHAGAHAKRNKHNPDFILGIMGCMSENLKEEIFGHVRNVDFIVGPRKTGAIPRILSELKVKREKKILLEDFDDEFIEPYHFVEARKHFFQAYIKIMEGCDMKCAFCVVPNTRGKEVSRRLSEIVMEAKKLADEGVIEITLLGQTVNAYGKGLKPYYSLARLLELLSEINGIKRIRFITSHPVFMKDELINAMAYLPKVCNYIHIPAQSGSDRILGLMRRRYTVAQYMEICQKIYDKVRDVAIASDFIVGFPTETDKEFRLTADLINDIKFQGSYIFKYSPRPNTDALTMADDVPFEVKHQRNLDLLDIQKGVSRQVNGSRVGMVEEVLIEGPSKSDKSKLAGRTTRNQIVVIEGNDRSLSGKIIKCKIKRVSDLTLFGEVI